MTDIYEHLARSLDKLPNGFPSTESGVELKILRKIFTPQEAEMALEMTPEPETAKAVAERLGKPLPEMQEILDGMVEKGQIGSIKIGGQHVYMLVPFVIGIYELQLKRIDKELSELFEEYLPTLTKTIGASKPALMRVVPVNSQIKAELNVPRYDDLRRMVKEARSFQLLECICRNEQSLLDHPCKHDLETCLGFSTEENAFDKYTKGRVLTKEEALEVLDKAEEDGLVQSSFNVEEGPGTHVCLCCPCCCALIRGLKAFKAPYLLAKSNFVATINQDTCAECGVCAEERCPVEAIEEDEGAYRVLPERCIGCGVCTPTCPTESIKLIRKPESEHYKPPANIIEWNMERVASRGMG